MLRLIANESRIELLCSLATGEKSVSELGACIDLAQSALAQHLATLKAHGLVCTRRKGRSIYYSLADPIVRKLITALSEVP